MLITLTQEDLDNAMDSFEKDGICKCLIEVAVQRELNVASASAGYLIVSTSDARVYSLGSEVIPYISLFDHLVARRVPKFSLPLPFKFNIHSKYPSV